MPVVYCIEKGGWPSVEVARFACFFQIWIVFVTLNTKFSPKENNLIVAFCIIPFGVTI